MSLKNKLALITGANSGIGNEISNLFAKEGATVIAIDIQEHVYEVPNQLDKTLNQQHSAFVCDVSNSEQVSKLFENISEKYKNERVPNVIVNCAGILIYSKLIDTTEDTFDKIVSVNLKGPFLIARRAVQELVKRYPMAKLEPLESYASIINISSISGKSAFPGNPFIYAATKAGLDSMSKVLACELAEYKIRVNSVAPGPIRTPMNDPSKRSCAKDHAEMTYMKRFGESSEVAELCVFLASEKSSYITGSSIDVTGGFN